MKTEENVRKSVEKLVQRMRDESLVDFVRSSDVQMVVDQITEFVELRQVMVNPYPKSVFPDYTRAEWEKINQLLKNSGFSLDRITGTAMRTAWDLCIETFKENVSEQNEN